MSATSSKRRFSQTMSTSEETNGNTTAGQQSQHSTDDNHRSSTTQQPVSTNAPHYDTIVVLHTNSQQAAAETHVAYLQEKGMKAVSMTCHDFTSFQELAVNHFRCVHILVDTVMWYMLMTGEKLKIEAERKFVEMAKRDKKVWFINGFVEDFDQFFHCIPRQIRRKWPQGATHQPVQAASNIGMTDGTSHNSTVIGHNVGDLHAFHFHHNSDSSVGKFIEEALKGSPQDLQNLLPKKDDKEPRGTYWRTPLLMAAQSDSLDNFKFLETKGYSLRSVDDDGNNVLHVACIGNATRVIQYILSKHIVDINSKGQYGWTSAMLAALMGHVSAFEILVRETCDLSAVDVNGDNILHLACLGGSVKIAKYILNENAVILNDKGQYGRTAVMKAAGNGHSELISYLIDQKCDLPVDCDGNNILHIACIGGSVDVVQNIVSRNLVDINNKGRYGWTPVMMAVDNAHYYVFKFLVDSKCDLSYQDQNSNNIFHIAAIGGNVEIAKSLLARDDISCGIDKENMFGQTPFQVAQSGKQEEFAKLFASQSP